MNLAYFLNELSPTEWELAVAYRDVAADLERLRAAFADQSRQLARFADAIDRTSAPSSSTTRQSVIGIPAANLVDIAAQTELGIHDVSHIIAGLHVTVVDGTARLGCHPDYCATPPALIARVALLHWDQTHLGQT